MCVRCPCPTPTSEREEPSVQLFLGNNRYVCAQVVSCRFARKQVSATKLRVRAPLAALRLESVSCGSIFDQMILRTSGPHRMAPPKKQILYFRHVNFLMRLRPKSCPLIYCFAFLLVFCFISFVYCFLEVSTHNVSQPQRVDARWGSARRPLEPVAVVEIS